MQMLTNFPKTSADLAEEWKAVMSLNILPTVSPGAAEGGSWAREEGGCGVCQFLWYKYSFNGQFQATNVNVDRKKC